MANGLSDRKADKQELMEITEEAYEAASQLLAAARPKKGSIFVVGCSTSEVGGERIGSFSSPELGQALFDGIYRAVKEAEVYLAAQCCEHLNRALILEEEAAECYGYEQVNVVPQPKAGGSFATAAYHSFMHPVAVEQYPGISRHGYWGYPHRHAFKRSCGSGAHRKTADWGSAGHLRKNPTEVYRRGKSCVR